MLKAVEYLGGVGVGITAPQLFRANDENVYVVKHQQNRLSPRVLVSEVFAARIGRLMGLCFPPSDIIVIEKQILNANPRIGKLGIHAGRHFASYYLSHAKYIGKNRLSKVINIAEMAGVILFDHIFHNADRAKNRKNLLLRLEDEKYKIYAIDNSHLFNSGRWNSETFRNLGTKVKIYYFQHYRDLLKHCLSARDFFPYIEIVKKISSDQIDCIVREIPKEWLPDEQERLALANYAKLRINMVDEIWEKIRQYVPRSGG